MISIKNYEMLFALENSPIDVPFSDITQLKASEQSLLKSFQIILEEGNGIFPFQNWKNKIKL